MAPPTSYGNPPGLPSPVFGPTNVYDVYQNAIAPMNAARDRQIQDAMAAAGLSGNRFSSSAQNTAARIGGETALKQNELLTNLLYNQGQADLDRWTQMAMQGNQLGFQGGQNELDRALQATGMMNNLGLQYNDMSRQAMLDLFNMAQFEQGRADQLSMVPYQDYMNSRLGYMQQLINAAGAQSGGQMPPPVTTTSGGGPGAMDYALQAAMIAAMFI